MIRPYFASEKLLAGPPFKGCRVSTLWHGYALATNNETAMSALARPKGKQGIRTDLQRGWDAFTKVSDANGIPDQSDVPRICEAMFPGQPKPEVRTFGSFAPILDLLDDKKCVSLALKLSALPPSSPVHGAAGNADHQVMLYEHRGDRVRMIDPMHEHSATYSGRWVPVADVRKAGAAFGRFFVEIFPIGGWTQEELLRRNVVRPLRAEKVALEQSRDRLQEANDRLKAANATLVTQLADCQAGAQCDAVVTALLDDLQTELDARRPA